MLYGPTDIDGMHEIKLHGIPFYLPVAVNDMLSTLYHTWIDVRICVFHEARPYTHEFLNIVEICDLQLATVVRRE